MKTVSTEVEEYTDELKQEFIDIIKKSNSGEQLSTREATMLFYWVGHQFESKFDFVEDALHLRSSSPYPKPKKRKYVKHKKTNQIKFNTIG